MVSCWNIIGLFISSQLADELSVQNSAQGLGAMIGFLGGKFYNRNEYLTSRMPQKGCMRYHGIKFPNMTFLVLL